MITDTMKEIRSVLKSDATIQNLLGGEYVKMSNTSEDLHDPCITLLENNEMSKKRLCYNEFKKRDNQPILQVDVWTKTSNFHMDQIANRIDELLVADTVTDTRGWKKVTGSSFFEDDTKFYHKALRYTFNYTVTDS